MYANFIWVNAAIGTCMPVAAVTASTHRCCYSLATQYILYYIVSMLICNISGGDRATWKLRGSLSYYPFKVCLDSSHVNSQPLGRLRVIGSLTSWFTLASPPGNVTLKGNDKRVSVSQVVPELSAPGLSARLLNVYVVCMQGFCSSVGLSLKVAFLLTNKITHTLHNRCFLLLL